MVISRKFDVKSATSVHYDIGYRWGPNFMLPVEKCGTLYTGDHYPNGIDKEDDYVPAAVFIWHDNFPTRIDWCDECKCWHANCARTMESIEIRMKLSYYLGAPLN